MSLRPHEFKIVSEFLGSLTKRLNSLEEAVGRFGEVLSGIRDETKAERKIQEEISGQISLLSISKEERKTDSADQERRHRENLRVQRSIMRGAWFTGVCTLLAFGAAAYYANEAHKQSVTMNNTYCEIQKQTKAAQQQIKLMQEQLEGTMAAVLDVTGNINVTLPAQNVSLSELL